MKIGEILNGTFSRIPECYYIILIGSDSLVVEQAGEIKEEQKLIYVEMMGQLNKLAKLLRENGNEAAKALTLSTGDFNLFITAVTEDYFLCVSTTPQGSAGKTKYEMLKASLDLKVEVS